MKTQGLAMNADLACQRAMDRLHRVGFEALTEKEKTLATVWTVQSAVENTGFCQLFAGDAGDLAPYAPTAFSRIGAMHMAEVVTRANAAFGPEGPPRDRATREPLVRSFSDE